MRAHARMRDGNEKEIIKALRAAGASVTPLNGAGVPDLLVGYDGATFLLEVKLPVSSSGKTTGGASRPASGGNGVLTEAQLKWWHDWRGLPAAIVTDKQSALVAIGYLCSACKNHHPKGQAITGCILR